MAKTNTHKSWLNIIIIAVSALILAFTLLGRFFGSGEQVSSSESQLQMPQFELTRIDFGPLQIGQNAGQWRAIPDDAIDQIQLEQLINQWNLLLNADIQQPNSSEQLTIQSASTVLLYLKGETRPLICKVVIAGKQSYVEFLASGQKAAISASFALRLLPVVDPMLLEPDQSNQTSQSTNEESDA